MLRELFGSYDPSLCSSHPWSICHETHTDPEETLPAFVFVTRLALRAFGQRETDVAVAAYECALHLAGLQDRSSLA